jgi:amino acid adenylation domain-containing protein
MIPISKFSTNLPPEQQAIRAKCFHPSGGFEEFSIEDVGKSIPERFEEIVRMYPDRIAVKTTNHTISYGVLNKMANRVARAILTQRGEGAEPIALLLGHDATMIASLIGVMKSGKTCVPLEPAFPPARTRDILEDSKTKLVVTNGDFLAAANELVNKTVRIINIDELDSGLADENVGLNIAPETLVYVLYTSGSTGRPKGVTQTHRNALHSAMAYINNLHIQADDRLTLLGSCSGAQGMKVAISALVTGASLYPWSIPEHGLANLANWLFTEGITIYISGASVFRSFVTTLRGGEQFPNLRVVRVGNEPVRRTDIELYQNHFSPHCIFVNWFAVTETGNVACYFMDNKTAIDEEIVPLGYRCDDTEIMVLDENGHRLGVNQTGEIAIKSRFLSPGYWRQQDLTRAKFLPDPNGGEARIFLSGDLGFVLPDGCLYHMGRKDFQVKVRGNRIEVGEIETALLALDVIKEAVVIVEERSADKSLVAYLVSDDKLPPTVGTLRRALAEKLPDHMIPSAFVLLDAMPVTPNGKIDRCALTELRQTRAELQAVYVTPRTPIEEILATIWADVFNLDRVGIHDNFFELGGHSLLATQIVFQVIKQFQVDLSFQSLFQEPTVADMAAVITEYQGKQLGQEALARVLSELELLSDEEAQRLVSQDITFISKVSGNE